MDLQRIGRYDIKSIIGQGGMSTVYLGYDPRSQREVAIKILPPYYLHAPKFRERFEREALMIALLEHPAIVPVYDMGEEEGQPYIVMRYMSGGSLSDKLKKGPIPLRDCMEMYLRLAPALDTAHARGVIHRDVKPDNLLFDKYDNVFLSDFGLARLRETIGFANISDGSVMGTPAYMSPEQIQGERELDGRSDIYSMGVVLYQMLCGSVPFSGTTAASVMMMHLVNSVPQIYDQNKSLPVAIQAVLDTALAKNPKDRYQSAGEFARAIQAVTTGVQRKPSHPSLEAEAEGLTRRSTLVMPARETGLTPANHAEAVTRSTPINGTQPPVPANQPAQGISSSRQGATLQLDDEKPASLTAPSASRGKVLRLPVPWWSLLVGLLVVVLLSLTFILRSAGIFPFNSLLHSATPPVSSQTAGSASQVASVPGQADKLAFLNASEIWVSNLDGSNLAQLTNDQQAKANLQWSPDGQSVMYTSGNCLNLVGMLTRQVLRLTCISGISGITAFDISADGKKAALGIDQTELYLVPYAQLFNLRQVSQPADLPALAQCSAYAPYDTREILKAANWSLDDGRLALLLSTLVNGMLRDEVTIIDVNQCTASPQLVKQILPAYFLFTFPEYYDHPTISSLSWNGADQLLLSNASSESGFGDLQLYSLAKNQGQEVAPNGACCYRDAHWSPDGTYLFYSYQPEAGGDIKLYYTPTAGLSQPGTAMASLALPEGFLAGSLESLQPALRAVH